MRRLNAFMGIMLFLTLVWLLSILYAQSSFGVCARLSVCLLLFYLLISLRRVFMEHLDYQKFELWVRKGVEKLINISAAVLLLYCLLLPSGMRFPVFPVFRNNGWKTGRKL